MARIQVYEEMIKVRYEYDYIENAVKHHVKGCYNCKYVELVCVINKYGEQKTLDLLTTQGEYAYYESKLFNNPNLHLFGVNDLYNIEDRPKRITEKELFNA